MPELTVNVVQRATCWSGYTIEILSGTVVPPQRLPGRTVNDEECIYVCATLVSPVSVDLLREKTVVIVDATELNARMDFMVTVCSWISQTCPEIASNALVAMNRSPADLIVVVNVDK